MTKALNKSPMELMLPTVNRVMDLTKDMMKLMPIGQRPIHKYHEKPFAHISCPVFRQVMQMPTGIELNGQVNCTYCGCAVPIANKNKPENLAEAVKIHPEGDGDEK